MFLPKKVDKLRFYDYIFFLLSLYSMKFKVKKTQTQFLKQQYLRNTNKVNLYLN